MLNLVFDLDGTLIDSLPSIHFAANKVFQGKGLPGFPEAVVRGFVGDGAGVLVSRLLRHCGVAADAGLHADLLAKLIHAYEEAHDLTTLYPGVRDALEVLQVSGHRLAICTNKPLRPALAVLRHFGLEERFAAVIGGDSLPERKPDPAPLHAAIAALGARKTIFVGDSEVDAATAAAANLPFALYTGDYRKTPADSLGARLIFDHHAALPHLITHLSGKL